VIRLRKEGAHFIDSPNLITAATCCTLLSHKMEGGRPQTAPTQRPPAAQRPLTAPAARSVGKSSDGQSVRFSEILVEESTTAFWAIPTPEPTKESDAMLDLEKLKLVDAPIVVASAPGTEKRVSFKGLHLEKAAIDEYHIQQQKMALACVSSIDGWEETKNSLIASIQNVIRPDIALSDKHRKTVLNSMLNNFFAVLHIPSFNAVDPNFRDELHSKVPLFLLQLEKEVTERRGMEKTVDLRERETKKGILGTYGKQFMVEAFISGISLARDDEESDLIVRRGALNEEYRKLQAMRKDLETSHAVLTGQRAKLDELVAQMKTKDQRIEELERQSQRRDASYADQAANFLKEIHSLKANYSRATSLAKATTHGIQNALLASSNSTPYPQNHVSQSAHNSLDTLLVESAKVQALELEHKKALDAEHKKGLTVQEKRIRLLEEALCNAQAINTSDGQMHRSSLANIINWASRTLKFEEDLFNLVEKSFRTDTAAPIATLNVSGKQLPAPNSAEKLSSLLALTQELSKVSIEVSKINSQKLLKFTQLSNFAKDLVTFIDQKDLALPKDLDSVKQELLRQDDSFDNEAIMMFPEGNHKSQKPISSEDADLRRILGKDRTGFRNSLLDLLLELQKKNSAESQKLSKTKHDLGHDSKHASKHTQEHVPDRDSHRKDSHDVSKAEQLKGKLRSVVLLQSPSLSSHPVELSPSQASLSQLTMLQLAAKSSPSSAPEKLQSAVPPAKLETHSIPSNSQPMVQLDDQSMASLTRQRDEYMERLTTLSAEMQQLQITVKDIQRQRTEIMTKTKADSDEMAMTILEITHERNTLRDQLAVLVETNRTAETNRADAAALMQQRDEYLEKLQQLQGHQQILAITNPHTNLEENVEMHVSSGETLAVQAELSTVVFQAQKQTANAMCQTIDLQSSKIVQMLETKEIPALNHDAKARMRAIQAPQIVEHSVLNSHQTTEQSMALKTQPSDANKIGAGHQENGTAALPAATAAAHMIFSATYRNLQTNLSNQRVASVFDEFDEGVRKDGQSVVSVPKIDLSQAFLESVGQTHANHFQQQSSYLPRFQKVAIRSKTEYKVDFQTQLSQRMTKSEEDLMAAIAPVAVSSSTARAKKPRPGIAVLEIPNRFDIPASQFSQPPYTSRPSTSNHLGLFIGVDIRPETARSSNSNPSAKPHRPASTRSADSKPSTRGAKVTQRASLFRVPDAKLSPTNQPSSPLHNTNNHLFEFLDMDGADGSAEIATHSEIIDEYLKEINVGLPS